MAERRKKVVSIRKKSAAKKPAAAKKVASVKPKAATETKAKHGSVIVYDMSGKSVDTLNLDPIFHEGHVNTDVIYQTVVMIQAGNREGTASTKDRGAVSGGGKKPWKQKGTGRARHASIRSPLWTGGGTTFGPHPRDYSFTVPQQIRRKAVVESIKSVASQGKLVVLKSLQLEQPKTKNILKIFRALKVQKPLVVVEKKTENLVLASRNLPGVSVRTAEEMNVLDVVSHWECVMTQDAYSGLLKRLKS